MKKIKKGTLSWILRRELNTKEVAKDIQELNNSLNEALNSLTDNSYSDEMVDLEFMRYQCQKAKFYKKYPMLEQYAVAELIQAM